MIRLLNFIIEIRDAFVLIICLLISLLFMITTEKDTGGPLRSAAMNSIGYLGQAIYRVQSYFNLTDENKELRIQNANLAYQNMQLQDALLENLRLRKLLGFREKTKLQ